MFGPTADELSLLWLKNSAGSQAAAGIPEANRGAAGIGLAQLFYRPSLAINFNNLSTRARRTACPPRRGRHLYAPVPASRPNMAIVF